LNKKIIPSVIIVLLLFAGIIAVTQETSVRQNLFAAGETPQWVIPIRWYRSNKGGMALEEISSRFIALHNEYSLAVEFKGSDELPFFLIPYYNDDFFIETRVLYENGLLLRTQWIFRDLNGTVRLNTVINDKQETAFIEIFDRNSFLVSEYNFLDNERNSRTENTYSDGILISSVVSFLQEGGEYIEVYTDNFRYNRSLYLRAVERVFYEERQISFSDEPVIIHFPFRLADIEQGNFFIGERIMTYPDFFGDSVTARDDKVVYTTDDRGRILSETLYDAYDNIVWVIRNNWQNDRIVSTSKTEDSIVLLAEFEYSSGGDRIMERNYRNGSLERTVQTDGKTDIEELYFNNVVILRAVWEDGRKISETRVTGP